MDEGREPVHRLDVNRTSETSMSARVASPVFGEFAGTFMRILLDDGIVVFVGVFAAIACGRATVSSSERCHFW